MLFGTTTKLPAFVSSFVARHVILADAAFLADRSSPSRRRGTGGRFESPDRRTGCRACPAGRSRARPRRRRSSPEFDRAGSASPRAPNSRISSVSWTIAGKRSGKRSSRHGFSVNATTRLMTANAITSGLIVAQQPARVVGKRQIVDGDCREGKRGEEARREQQPAADVPVDRRPAQGERRHQQRKSGDDAERKPENEHAGLGDPLPECRHVSR